MTHDACKGTTVEESRVSRSTLQQVNMSERDKFDMPCGVLWRDTSKTKAIKSCNVGGPVFLVSLWLVSLRPSLDLDRWNLSAYGPTTIPEKDAPFRFSTSGSIHSLSVKRS